MSDPAFAYMTTQEAAEALGLTDSYIRWMIRKKRMAARAVGGRAYAIPLESVRAFERQRKPKQPRDL